MLRILKFCESFDIIKREYVLLSILKYILKRITESLLLGHTLFRAYEFSECYKVYLWQAIMCIYESSHRKAKSAVQLWEEFPFPNQFQVFLCFINIFLNIKISIYLRAFILKKTMEEINYQ